MNLFNSKGVPGLGTGFGKVADNSTNLINFTISSSVNEYFSMGGTEDSKLSIANIYISYVTDIFSTRNNPRILIAEFHLISY